MSSKMNASDIAKIAGVSRSTVSRVVNNYGNVPKETKEKVLEIIKRYNYVPHASAQMLAGKKNRIIGLFIIDTKDENNFSKMSTSSYFSPVTSEVVDAANKQQYNVLISIINKQKDFVNVKEIFYNKTISAGIFVGGMNNDPDIAEIIESGYKVAILEQEIKGEQDPFSKSIVVNCDSFGGAYEATKYLIELGHINIGHITGDLKQLTAISKLEGYKKALSDNNISLNNNLVLKGDYSEESGYKATKKLITKENLTALFIGNDSMTLGAIRAINEQGLRVPDDISLIGFDDIELAGYLKPSLSTVKVSLSQMASIATNSLIQSIEEEMDFYANYKVPVELIIRESCKRIK